MGVIVLSYQSSEAAVDEETKKKRIKRKKLLVTVQKNRQLMNDSWRQILLTKQVTDDDSIVPGLTAFCQEFKRINDSYGELRLNLQSCKTSSVAGNLTSMDSLCMHLLKHIMAVKIESTRVRKRVFM